MKQWIFIGLMIAATALHAQNLVPNPSFEDATHCPGGISELSAVTDWLSPLNTTPDYYHPCNTGTVGVPVNAAGYQQPRTGKSYVGFLAPQWATVKEEFIWSEYLSARLMQPFVAGHKYYVSFYVSHAEQPNYVAGGSNVVATDKIGAVFTDTAIKQYININDPKQTLDLQPNVSSPAGIYITDTVNWVKIDGFYTAHGGEQFITIGRFQPPGPRTNPIAHQVIHLLATDADNEAYYFLDDVCVTDMANAITSNTDTVGFCNQSVVIAGRANGSKYFWSTGDTTATISVGTGIYWVGTLGECIYTVDTFHVSNGIAVNSGATAACRNGNNGKAWVQPRHGDTAIYVYTWKDAVGNTLQQHISDTGDSLLNATIGTYMVAIQSFAFAGCASTQIMITVPVVNYTATFTADTIACQGSVVQFNNTSTDLLLSIWQFGDGDSAVQKDTSHIYTQPGTYDIVLTATSTLGCMDTAMQRIVVDTTPYIRFTIDKDNLCLGQAINIEFAYSTDGIVSIQWQFGNDIVTSQTSSQQTYAFDKSGSAIIKLTAHYRVCADTSAIDTVMVYPYPNVNIGTDTGLCPGQAPILLSNLAAAANADITYLWNTGETGNSILATAPGSYWLRATMNNRCSAADTILIAPDCYIAIPNAFSPNGDGINDYFYPRELLSHGLTTFHMQIFNRWGQIVFETSNTDGHGWDGAFNGSLQPEGAYVYLIEVAFVNGRQEKYKGNVTLLR